MTIFAVLVSELSRDLHNDQMKRIGEIPRRWATRSDDRTRSEVRRQLLRRPELLRVRGEAVTPANCDRIDFRAPYG